MTSRIDQLRELEETMRTAAEASERSLRETVRERADQARSGELGEDWRKVQERIDEGRTTLQRVLTGADDAPSAQAVAALSRRNLADLAENGEPPAEVADALEGLREEMRRRAGGRP